MKIISIANQKGGCGKTTTAINLASTLSYNGKKTLLIDLDPQAHATLGLNIDDQNSLYNVISKLTPRKLKVSNIIQRVDRRFDIVPSNILVGTLEQELSDEIGRELKLTEVIDEIRDLYDYVLIDCPPSLGFLTVNAMRASDEVIIPVETSRFSMQGVDHLMDIVNLIKDRLNHPVLCRILVTMFDSRLRHSFSMMAKFKEKFSDLLLDTIIHINVKLKESAVMGQSVIKYDKYCRGSKDYFTLSKEIITYHEKALKNEQSTDAAAQVDTSGMSGRMKELVQREVPDFMNTAFKLHAPEAHSVYVTGSFNDWSLDESCRMSNDGGTWRVSLPLKEGLHKYQFIVDGKWQEDPANERQERNSFGDINSILEVNING